MANELSERLQKMEAKYRPTEAQQQVYTAIDAQSARASRISGAPSVAQQSNVGDWMGKQVEIKALLADKADEYGHFNNKFQHTLGKRKILSLTEGVMSSAYRFVGMKAKARKIKVEAAKRHGKSLEILVDTMGDVVGEKYDLSTQGESLMRELMVDIVGQTKNYESQLIQNLKNRFTSTADYDAALAEVKRMESEILEIETLATDYEAKIRDAQDKNDQVTIDKLTGELVQVMDIKHGLMDGRLSADGTASEIRRKILDYAETSQSLKGALAATAVNYRTAAALLDMYSELQIKYRNMKNITMPVFKTQATLAQAGEDIGQMRDVLLTVSQATNALMEANRMMVVDLTEKVTELFQTPIYDVNKARQIEGMIKTYYDNKNKQKIEWAKAVSQVSDSIPVGHYGRHT